jgi:anti-anti-sigma factor
MRSRQAFTVGVVVRGPYGVVRVEGELDIAAVPQLYAEVRRAARRMGRVVVDLRPTTFMDTFALRALLCLQSETWAHGGSFHVVAGDGIQRVLDLSGARQEICWISAEQLVD